MLLVYQLPYIAKPRHWGIHGQGAASNLYTLYYHVGQSGQFALSFITKLFWPCATCVTSLSGYFIAQFNNRNDIKAPPQKKGLCFWYENFKSGAVVRFFFLIWISTQQLNKSIPNNVFICYQILRKYWRGLRAICSYVFPRDVYCPRREV